MISLTLSIAKLLSVFEYFPPVVIDLIMAYVSVGYSITEILEPPSGVMLLESFFPSRFTKFDPVFPSFLAEQPEELVGANALNVHSGENHREI